MCQNMSADKPMYLWSNLLLRLLLVCLVFSICHCQSSEAAEPLQKMYEVREDTNRSAEIFRAQLPYPEARTIEIQAHPVKPLRTKGEVIEDGIFRVILEDDLIYKARDPIYNLDLKFFSTDKTYIGVRQVQLSVIQVNRHPPRFNRFQDTFNLPEEVEGGHKHLLDLRAIDDDDRDELDYSLKNSADLDDKFVLTSDWDKDGNYAILQNPEKLDYETKTYYRIEVIAKDNVRGRIKYGGQHTSMATIHIYVEDVDDQPPIFQKECGVKKIKEHSKDPLTMVHAIDGDRGINNPIGYSLANASIGEFFKVSKQTGGDALVAVTNPIDREDPRFITNPLLTFGIQADEYSDTELFHKVENRSALSICTVIIEDINDNPPTFSSPKYIADVKENTQIGIPVNFQQSEPHVFDIDEGENAMFVLSLQGNNGTFSVTPEEGINNVTFLLRVLNDTALDYERTDLIEPKHLQLQIVAKEKNPPEPITTIATVIVYLHDENDNFPQFTSPEMANISENASQGDPIIKIEAEDIDSGWFGTDGIRYSLMPSYVSKSFSLDPVSGELTVGTNNHGFDRETVDTHYLTIEARDNNGTGNRNTTQLRIELLDANDNPPIFLFSSYRAQLIENSKEFIEPLILIATDRDKEGTPNSEVRYVISDGEFKELFQIDDKKGILTQRSSLDFEDAARTPETDQPCISICTKTYKLIVTAYDLGVPQQSSNVNVTISLTDENDNIPRFLNPNVMATINETSSEGTHVADVQAVDDDISPLYNNVSYSIVRGGDGNFVIHRVTGRITVARNADLDVSYNETKKRRHLEILASDPMMLGSSAQVLVNIVDINDKPPQFQKVNSTELELLENVKDICIGSFPAHDPDETALLSYSIDHDQTIALKPDLLTRVNETYNYSGIFEMMNEGELCVVNPADREEMKQISLLLKVVDLNAEVNLPQQDTLRIRITILDENDNDPMFIRLHTESGYLGRVQENVKDVTLLNVYAIDIDENNTITYSIDGDEKIHKHFHLNPSSGELRIIHEADYEEDHYFNFTAVATDSGVPSRSTTTGIFIEIIDQNDNSPEFQDQPYITSIEEHVPEGTFVIQVNATDKDSGDYGLVYFRIPKFDPDDDYFDIERDTGIIKVKKDLDREVQEVFRINVEAYDNPRDDTNQRTAATNVKVTLLDINDHAPEIAAIDGCVRIPETTDVKSDVVRITATDKDKENTPNSEVEFLVEKDDYFDITPDGLLFVNASLRDLHTELWVVVMAKDKGEPPLNSTKRFCVEVYDMNTHKPEFVRPEPGKTDPVAIDENTPRGKEVYQFRAKDDDNNKETNGRITYKLVGDLFQDDKADFFIDPDRGTLTVNAILDKGRTPVYKVEVEACDNGEPKLCADAKARLDIYIRSEMDTKPHFPKTDAEVSFTEHSIPGAEHQDVPKAELKEEYVDDFNIPICYYIVGGDAEVFNLDKETGRLTLAKEVDREIKAFYSIIVQANVDCVNNPPKIDRTSRHRPDLIDIRVRIIDINDNAPIFTKKEFSGGVNAKDKAGKHILTIYATDADEGENAVITYHIVSNVQVNNGEGLEKVSLYFNLNKTTGDITLAFQPTANMKGHFTFTVMATDIDDLNDTAQVSIYLMRSDQQVKLIISKDVNEITDEDISLLQTVLMDVTGHIVNIDDVVSYSGDNNRYKGFTEVFIHIVDPPSNEVLESGEALRIIDKNYVELVQKLQSIGLVGGEKYVVKEESKSFFEEYGYHILYGLIGFLSFFIILLLIVYFVRINSYKRFLKAATARAFGPNDNELNDLSKNAVPNTNLHAIQGSNPIWNQDDIIKKISQDDALSENGSTNSLDINVIEPTTVEEQGTDNPVFNIEDEENERNYLYLAPESPATAPELPPTFEETNNICGKSNDLGSSQLNRLQALQAVDNDWRRRLTSGSITPIKSEQNFSFGKLKLGESDDV